MSEGRLKVYIAAPYTPKNCSLHEASRVAHENVQHAINLASLVMQKGHLPIVPHLSHYLFLNTEVEVDPRYWYDLGLALLSDCDVLYTLRIESDEGGYESEGVEMEITYAENHNIPIIRDVHELPKLGGEKDE